MNTTIKMGRPKKAPQAREDIDNKTIERMFLMTATGAEIGTYYDILANPKTGHLGRATAYASKVVFREFKTILSATTGLDYSDATVND